MLLNQVREKARVKHFSIRTERCYVYWTERYLRFLKGAGDWRHPGEVGTAAVEAFLTDLAVAGGVSASTQNQALATLLFLYHEVLDQDIGRLDAVRARRPARVPLVLSGSEVRQLLEQVERFPIADCALPLPTGLLSHSVLNI